MAHITALSLILNVLLLIHALGVYYEAQRLKRVYKTKQAPRRHNNAFIGSGITKRSRITLN